MAWSRFYGTVRGKAGEASRLGNENSGLRVEACSKNGAIVVELQSADDDDRYWINMRTHGNSRGWEGNITRGIMGQQPAGAEPVGILPTPTIESFTDEALAAEVKRRFNFELVLRQPNPPTR